MRDEWFGDLVYNFQVLEKYNKVSKIMQSWML